MLSAAKRIIRASNTRKPVTPSATSTSNAPSIAIMKKHNSRIAHNGAPDGRATSISRVTPLHYEKINDC